MSAANGYRPMFAAAAPPAASGGPSLLPPPTAPSSIAHASARTGTGSAAAAARTMPPAAYGAMQQQAAGGGGSGDTGGWTEHTAQDGRKYYFNSTTQKTTWEKPEELKSESERIMANCLWRESRTPEGKVYYWHSKTQQTVWTKPDELLAAERAAELANQRVASMAVGSQPLAVGSPATEIQQPPMQQQTLISSMPQAPEITPASASSAIEEAMKKTLESFAIQSPIGGSHSPSGASDSDDDEDDSDDSRKRAEKSKNKKAKEAPVKTVNKEELFKEILRDRKVPSSAQWETAVRMIQEDPRYAEIKHLKNRRQIFNIYKTQRQKEEKEEQRLKVKRAREELENFLLTTTVIQSNVRFRRAEKLFGELKVWTAVSERDRRDIFEDAMRTIAERERQQMKALQRRNIENFADILSSIKEINYLTTWTEAQKLLSGYDRFRNDMELLNMDKEDALICFQTHITKLEKEEDDRKEEEHRMLRRQQRKNREAFTVLLEELRDLRRLNANSLWKDCFQYISSDERFEQMLHQPGSTPLDLFKFFIEDLRHKFPEEKRIVKEIMKDKAFTITPDTQLEEFLPVINSDERGRALDAGNVERSFNSLRQKALSIDEEKRAAEKRSLQKQADAFKELLADADPPVGVDTSWDAVKERFGDDPAFTGISLESERLIVFKEFLKSLADNGSIKQGKKKKKKKKEEKDKDKEKKNSKSKKKSDDRSDSEDADDDNNSSREPKKKKRRKDSGDESDADSLGRKDKKKRKHKKKKKKKEKGKDKDKDKEVDTEPEEERRAVRRRRRSSSNNSSSAAERRSVRRHHRDSNDAASAGTSAAEFDLSEGELEEKRQRLIAQLRS